MNYHTIIAVIVLLYLLIAGVVVLSSNKPTLTDNTEQTVRSNRLGAVFIIFFVLKLLMFIAVMSVGASLGKWNEELKHKMPEVYEKARFDYSNVSKFAFEKFHSAETTYNVVFKYKILLLIGVVLTLPALVLASRKELSTGWEILAYVGLFLMLLS